MTDRGKGMTLKQLNRFLDAIQDGIAELDAMEKQEDWFVSDSLPALKRAETELLLEIENQDA